MERWRPPGGAVRKCFSFENSPILKLKFEEFRDFNSNLISTTVKDKVVKLFAYLSFLKNKVSVRVYVRTRGPVTAPGSNGGIEPSGVGVVGG